MKILYAVPRKLTKVGRSFAVSIPRFIVDELGLESGDIVYAYERDGHVIYSRSRPVVKGTHRLRLRVQYVRDGLEYCILAVPLAFVRRLGLAKGDRVVVGTDGEVIFLTPDIRA